MATRQNGCRRFECRSTNDLARPFRSRPQNVAAIDFGTTNCSLMYLLSVDIVQDPSKAQPVRLKFDGQYRVPNCAFFDAGRTMKAFGLRAQRQYHKNTKRDELKSVYFFQKIKMHLQHDRVSQFIHYTVCSDY